MKKPYKTTDGICGGVPVFPGSRLPVYFLMDCIDSDTSLDEFFYAWGDTADTAAVEAILTYPLPPSLRYAKSPV